jgi:hypothetical protein
VQLRCREFFPAGITPTLAAMRPNPPPDPTVKPAEELSDMGFLGIKYQSKKKIDSPDEKIYTHPTGVIFVVLIRFVFLS